MSTFVFRRSVACALVAIACFHASADPQAPAPGPYAGHRIALIDIQSQKDYFVASQIGEPLVCSARSGLQEFLVPPDALPVLEASGLRYVITIEDVQRFVDDEAREITDAAARGGSFFSTYRTYDEILAHLDMFDTLPQFPPEQVEKFAIGQTIQGRTVYALRVSSPKKPGEPPRPTFLITAGQHAREWASVSSGMYIIDTLVNGYGVNPRLTSLVDSIEFIFVPVVNPDGYIHTFPTSQGGGGNRFWRKNRRNNGTSFGVDINRNWSVGWGGPGSSSVGSSETYRGTAPFSEPETQNIRRLVEGDGDWPGLPNLKGMIDLHTYSELVLAPWGYTSTPAPREWETGPLTVAQVTAINSVNGELYTGGPAATTLYFASGVAPDWAFGEHDALAWTYELRPRGNLGVSGFALPASQIIPTGEETLAGVLVLADYLTLHVRITLVSVTDPLPLIGGGEVTAHFQALNAYTLDESSPRLFWRHGSDGLFNVTTLTPGPGAGQYSAPIASPPCGENFEYYIEAMTVEGGVATLPFAAPESLLVAQGAPCPDCIGDADGNRTIDFVDISAVIANWDASGGLPGPPATIGDANWDGVVNFDDINATLANWGATCP